MPAPLNLVFDPDFPAARLNEVYRARFAKAKAAVEHMATVIEDEDLRAIFRKSAPVQAIYDCAVRVC